MAQFITRVLKSVIKRDVKTKAKSEKFEDAFSGFDGRRGTRSKKCRQPLESVKGKAVDFLLEPLEGM